MSHVLAETQRTLVDPELHVLHGAATTTSATSIDHPTQLMMSDVSVENESQAGKTIDAKKRFTLKSFTFFCHVFTFFNVFLSWQRFLNCYFYFFV